MLRDVEHKEPYWYNQAKYLKNKVVPEQGHRYTQDLQFNNSKNVYEGLYAAEDVLNNGYFSHTFVTDSNSTATQTVLVREIGKPITVAINPASGVTMTVQHTISDLKDVVEGNGVWDDSGIAGTSEESGIISESVTAVRVNLTSGDAGFWELRQ